MKNEVTTPDFLNDERNYIVKRTPNDRSLWSYQIYNSRLQHYSAQSKDFHIVVVCDAGVPQQKVIAIPYSCWRKNIFPNAYRDNRGRYAFEVMKDSLIFTWRHGIGMDGRQFLIEK